MDCWFLIFLTICLIKTTTGLCENSIITAKEGQSAQCFNFYLPQSWFKWRALFHWTSNEIKSQRTIAEIFNDNNIHYSAKDNRYKVSIDNDHASLDIHNVTKADAGLYISISYLPLFKPVVIRLSVEEAPTELRDEETFVGRLGSRVEFPNIGCNATLIFFKLSHSFSPWKYIRGITETNNISPEGCFHINSITERHEGCYMFFKGRFSGIHIQRLQLSDLELAVTEDGIYCVENPPVSSLPFHLEHKYNGKTIRQHGNVGNTTLHLALLPIMYLNNGLYQCMSYIDKNKSKISQNKTFVFEYKGVPVFTDGNTHIFHGVYGENLTAKVLVYSNPKITDIAIEVVNRSDDMFVIHNLIPATFDGWIGQSVVTISGWAINIGMMFQIPQNVTMFITVRNKFGDNRLQIIAIIEEHFTPVDFFPFSYLSVLICFMGIIIVCIIATTTVNIVILRRRTLTVEQTVSPYTYDEIGTLDFRLTNSAPLITDLRPRVPRRIKQNRENANVRTFDNNIFILTQEELFHNTPDVADSAYNRTNLSSRSIGVQNTKAILKTEVDATSDGSDDLSGGLVSSKDDVQDNMIHTIPLDESNVGVGYTESQTSEAAEYINLKIW